MIDVYIGKIGIPESGLALEFDNFAEASQFCNILQEHYKEEREILYMAIDRAREFEALELMFKDEEGVENNDEIDAEMFGKIFQMQAQGRR